MSAKKPARTKGSGERPKLYKISEELRAWAAMLADEAARWPGVRTKPMFGLVSLYRGEKIFAAIPKTRAVASPNSIIFKFHAENAETRQSRRQLQEYPAMKWLAFELHSERDLSAVLRLLDLAYRVAK